MEQGHSFQGVLAPIPARYSALWTGVSLRRRYLGGREREEKDRDTHPYRGRMGRAKAGIVETTIPGGKRKRGEGSGYSPIQREDGKGEGGYRRVDDTSVMDCWAEEVVLPT